MNKNVRNDNSDFFLALGDSFVSDTDSQYQESSRLAFRDELARVSSRISLPVFGATTDTDLRARLRVVSFSLGVGWLGVVAVLLGFILGAFATTDAQRAAAALFAMFLGLVVVATSALLVLAWNLSLYSWALGTIVSPTIEKSLQHELVAAFVSANEMKDLAVSEEILASLSRSEQLRTNLSAVFRRRIERRIAA